MKEENVNNVFEKLYGIDVSDKVEKKNKLNYLSWAYAWAEVKKIDNNAEYTISCWGEDKRPYLYDEKLGYLVMTNVTILNKKHSMWLPVMNEVNKAMLDHPYTYEVNVYGLDEKTNKKKIVGKETKIVEAATMFDINKTLMRCFVKNIAMFGLGLALYTGEDLPEQQINTKEEAESYVINFGKYKDKNLKEILDLDKGYIDWLFNNDKTDEVIKKCITLITGKEKQSDEENQEIIELLNEFNKLVIETDTDIDRLYEHYQIKNNSEMTKEQLIDAINILKQKVGN